MAKAVLPDGLRIIKMLEGNAKGYDALGSMTRAIIRAVNAGNDINLEKAFDKSKKGKNAFYDQLRIAVGVFEERESDGKVVPIGAAERFFANDTKRTNFAHQLRKCAQVAAGLIDMNVEVRLDRKKGTLVISGPAVRKEFGEDEVMLDERHAEGLTQKPSFTAIASIAQAKRDIVATRGSNTRGARAVVSSDSELERLCMTLVQDIRRCRGRLTMRQTNALRAVSSAIQGALG